MRRRLTLYRAVGRKGGKAFDVDIVVNRPDRFWVAVRRLGGQAGDSLRWSINIGFVSLPSARRSVFALSAAEAATRLPVAEATLLPPSICFRPPVRRSAGPPVRPPARPPSAYPHLPHPHCAQV